MSEQKATAGAMADLLFGHRPVITAGPWATVVGCQCMDRVFVAGREDYASHIVAVLGPSIRAAKAEAWTEGFESDYEGDGWPPNPYLRTSPDTGSDQ